MDQARVEPQLIPLVSTVVVQVVRPSGFSKRHPAGAGTTATASPSLNGAGTMVPFATVIELVAWSFPTKESPLSRVDTVTVCAPVVPITNGVAKVKVALAPAAIVPVKVSATQAPASRR